MLRTIARNRPKTLLLTIGVGAILAITIVMMNVVTASASSAVSHDPKGDAVLESGAPAPGYLDVKSVKITEQNGSGNIVFSCNLAAPVPSAFDDDVYHEFCGLSLNIGEVPPGIPGLPQYVVIVRWNTIDGFEGKLIDYTGGFPPGSKDIEFKITGSTVKAIVPSADLGDPEELTWISLSREKAFVGGSPFEGVTDFVPDGGTTLGEWKSNK
jgi:hypothetical protein